MDNWQLQHRRSLAFDEQRHHDIASIGKFDRVVMAMRHIWFDHTKLSGAAMTRISISNAALEGIFHERMKAFVECPPEMKIAIASVESKRWGWMAITKPSDRIAHPDCAMRVAEIEAELRVMFDLVDD